ncbi:MAG TPA: cobalamin-dependent protein [Desulfomonilaceae bacterium]|nr:cobalamin-dependent protein [Desulfomonilaceae bacterium]HVN83069.1 cobalamin-dependent protein [Terriglobia bacterium]
MENLRAAIKAGDQQAVKVELDALLGEGHTAGELLDVMIESLREVGEAFSRGEAFITQMLIAAMAMQAGSDHLGPELVKSSGGTKLGKFMIATVSGDLHDVGKNLVALVFKANGFDVVDLGVDVPASRIVAAYEEHLPDIVGLSALLTTTMPAMAEAVQAVKMRYPHVKVMVGGAPITKKYAESIGADAYAPDAAAAAEVARKLLAV